MKIQIPDYQLLRILRNYETLAAAYKRDGNDRAANAQRVARKEIDKVRRLIEKQHKEHERYKTTGD